MKNLNILKELIIRFKYLKELTIRFEYLKELIDLVLIVYDLS